MGPGTGRGAASPPSPDPDFAGVVVEVPEEEPVLEEEIVPEISSEDLEEVIEVVEPVNPAEPAGERVEVEAVSWVDEEPRPDEVVSLDALLVTPPPVHAQSLAPPLPPPSPTPPPIPHPVEEAAGAEAAVESVRALAVVRGR